MTTPRETIRNLLTGSPRTRVGFREVNIWPETLAAWVTQGYPTERVPDETGQLVERPVDWRDHLGVDMLLVGGGFDTTPIRGYREVLDETDDWIIVRNGSGAAFKRWKHHSGTPEHIDFRMSSRDIWERDYRPHLLQPDRDRVPIDATRETLQRRRAEELYTYYQHVFVWENMRQQMGDVAMYESLALDPAWIHDYCRVYTDFFIAHWRLLFEEAGVPDGIRLCEDLGYKAGLFCSPRTLRELIFPYYRELIEFLHGYGLLVELHSCGNVMEALPLIVEVGFDILNPLEVKAGCDIFQLAEQYGDRLSFIGGLDVRVLESGDRALIRREVGRLVDGMKVRGARYMFGSDHSLTPLIRYRDYIYARDVYREHSSYGG